MAKHLLQWYYFTKVRWIKQVIGEADLGLAIEAIEVGVDFKFGVRQVVAMLVPVQVQLPVSICLIITFESLFILQVEIEQQKIYYYQPIQLKFIYHHFFIPNREWEAEGSNKIAIFKFRSLAGYKEVRVRIIPFKLKKKPLSVLYCTKPNIESTI